MLNRSTHAGELVPPGVVGRQPPRQAAHAVVSVPDGYHLSASGSQSGHVHRHVVGLRPAVDEIHTGEVLGQGAQELLGELMDFVVQVQSGGVPDLVQLLLESLVQMRVAMAHTHSADAPESVKVSLPLNIVKVLLPASGHMHRLLVHGKCLVAGGHRLAPDPHQLLSGWPVVGRRLEVKGRQCGSTKAPPGRDSRRGPHHGPGGYQAHGLRGSGRYAPDGKAGET
mmetsp:Transcript_15838/g.36109  ORF Transcript_15838/g.36109 Transcript_15838/m.36109 type:complete len:225 (-) Transcript_15838:20-694(-)